MWSSMTEQLKQNDKMRPTKREITSHKIHNFTSNHHPPESIELNILTKVFGSFANRPAYFPAGDAEATSKGAMLWLFMVCWSALICVKWGWSSVARIDDLLPNAKRKRKNQAVSRKHGLSIWCHDVPCSFRLQRERERDSNDENGC